MAYAPPGPPVVSGQFQVFGADLPLGWCAKVKIPIGKNKPTKAQSAGNAVETKFPSGIVEFDDLELELFHAADQSAVDWLLAWQAQCANPASTGAAGTGTTPAAAKRVLTVAEMDGASNTVAEWRCVGCFPLDLGSLDHEAGKEDAVKLTLKFSVDRVEKV